MRRERKLVSVVFCDLVGFTSRAESLDPEDVEAILRPYHERLRLELERHGGTVEKFIGDAVMAVFGAPQVREDDAERAVRAALAIRDWASEEDDLEVRIAVNTGEALVSLDARPEAGEAMVAGDVVNTAARLQAAAPVNGILAGEQTHRATSHVIDYRESEPVEAKGKAKPVATWEALQAKAGFGVDVRQLARAELVGRDEELRVLRDAFEHARAERQPRAVTLVGAPGLGKSRLVYELFRMIEADSELVYWRQGRCLPYGEGVSFWALAEVAKAQAGILETDSSDDAEAKLRRAVSETVGEGGDAEWVLTHVRPLVGLTGDGAAGESRQAESFFAWRRFLEAVASDRPFVLVFEDLHWADERFLDFVEHLLEWAADVPLLLVCTSRPELLTRRPGWTDTVQLSPLSDDDTASLVHALLERAVLPAEVQAALLERAGGNPLYAEEFARMVGERGSDGELPLPETVQGLIAARIDGLPREDKELLQDAAVVGKVFWAGVVAAIASSDRWELEERLQGLARRDFLRRERRSSVEGESEYAFLHVLVRDVAYGSIPRAARAEKHRLAAEWIESLSEDRTEDRAELLAHHYGEALELARASGAAEEAQRLEEPARRYLIMAGDRAFRLDVAKAASYYHRALAALPPDDPEWARLTVKVADTAQEDGRLHEAAAGYEEAIPKLLSHGWTLAAGEAMVRLSRALWRLGGAALRHAQLEEAIKLLEQQPPGPELTRAYAMMTTNHALAGRGRDALEWCQRAFPLADQFGLDQEVVRLLQMRGIARCDLGDWQGLDDLREALRIALDAGLGIETGTSYLNLGEQVAVAEGLAKGIELVEAGLDFAARRGLTHHVMWSKTTTLRYLFELGDWDELLRRAAEVIEWDVMRGRSQISVFAQESEAKVLAWRGQIEEAGSLVEEFLPRARSIGDLQVLTPALTTGALVEQGKGELRSAASLLGELEDATRAFDASTKGELTDLLRICSAAGVLDLARRFLEPFEETSAVRHTCSLRTARAVLTEAEGDIEAAARLYAEAVDCWTHYGSVLEGGLARLGLGRCLVRLGQFDHAAAPLTEALEAFVGLGARPLVAETDALLAEATAAAS